MKIDTRKLRRVINQLLDDLDKMPQTKKEWGNDLRSIGAGIGAVGNYHISLDINEWDCPVEEMANIAEVVTGERDVKKNTKGDQ